ncbi:hypothetical protein GTO27_05375 [Candidatus Bathyarchaeota archaeon]|nr:hypothetical protein [Candidatus Bathyarchaeota archaeon]
MLVPPVQQIAVDVNHKLAAAKRNRIVPLVFLAYSFREQPVQNREIDMER